jgi:hypothetical protein
MRRASTTARPAGLAVVALLVGAVAACAVKAQVTRVSERTYRVECNDALAPCLVPVQNICHEHGYDVLDGTEQRSVSGGVPPEGYESVKAVATVRCRQAKPLFGADPNAPVLASATSVPRPAPAPSAAPPPPAVTTAAPPPAVPPTDAPPAPALPPPAAVTPPAPALPAPAAVTPPAPVPPPAAP